MNMKALAKSRKKIRRGDIFAFQIEGLPFMFGRVIDTEAKIGPMINCILIYIYNAKSDHKHKIPELDKSKLLVPPIITNTLPWRRGYFENIAFREIEDHDVLLVHCFVDSMFHRYYDEKNNRLPIKYEPCGDYGLDSYRTIDDEVSEALGVTLSED